MKSETFKLILQLILISGILFSLQWFLTDFYMNETIFYIESYKIYVFHFLTTLIIVLTLIKIKKIIPDKIGFTFMGFSILKMAASIIFLLPLTKESCIDPIPDVLAFFIPYFIFLFYETFYLVSLLNNDFLHKAQ